VTPVSSRASSLGIVARDMHVQYYAGRYGGQPPILGMRMHALCFTNLPEADDVEGSEDTAGVVVGSIADNGLLVGV